MNSSDAADAICVITTTDSEDAADTIARGLVEQRLAACVQVQGPIRSTYRWQGEVQQAAEWLCTAKTRRSLYSEVESAIRGLHSYDEPEIIAMPIIAGSDGYLAWLQEQLRSDNSD